MSHRLSRLSSSQRILLRRRYHHPSIVRLHHHQSSPPPLTFLGLDAGGGAPGFFQRTFARSIQQQSAPQRRKTEEYQKEEASRSILNDTSWKRHNDNDDVVPIIPVASSAKQPSYSDEDRRRAARRLSYWLSSSSGDGARVWRDRTMQHLNIPLPASSSSAANNKKDARTSSFRKTAAVGKRGANNNNTDPLLQKESGLDLYYDSFASFHERIQQHVGDTTDTTGTNKDNNSTTISPDLQQALDRLVEAGFATRGFARRFRKFDAYQARMDDWQAEILGVQAELDALQQKHARLVRQAAKAQKRYDKMSQEIALEEEDEAAATAANSAKEAKAASVQPSLLGQSLTAIKRFFASTESQEESTAAEMEKKREAQQKQVVASKLVSKMRHMERKLKSQQQSIASRDSHIANVTKRLERLKHQRASLPPPLPVDEYEKASRVVESVMDVVCQSLAEHIGERHSKILEEYRVLDAKTDLTKPHEWFPYARLDRRKIIFHGGPTNSGKTYTALERLKQAKKGMYLGPLRLLAAEVYEQLTVAGVYCNLYTGQERREIPFATHGAATVEMASLSDDFDIIVIDEIQMIADQERGFAWTRALLGSRCKEIHVCGGMEALDIVQRIANACGDDFEYQTYDRFTDLKVAKKSLARSPHEKNSYRNVKKGDCVVAFSRNDLFAIKREIETSTNHKCCLIYGSLPPQTRSEQARLFNDPDSGFDVLVASDAIGMGLNLNIRRIIFNSIFKHDGNGIVRLGHSAVKQISGRAGRRNSPYPEGEVTVRCPEDMDHLRTCMETEIESIERAGLIPTESHIESFDSALEHYGLSEGDENKLHKTLQRFSEMASIQSDFFLCRQTEMHSIAQSITPFPLTVREKYTLCMCPVNANNSGAMDVLRRFASKLAAGEVSGLTQSQVPRPPRTFEELSRLCHIFSELELFLWLQHKFPPGNMMEQTAAQARKELTIGLVNDALQVAHTLKLNHCYVSRDLHLRGRNTKRRQERNTKRRSRPGANGYDRRKFQKEHQKERSRARGQQEWNKGVPDI